MSRYPLLGTAQRDAVLDPTTSAGARRRVLARHIWRASDGVLTPLNPELAVQYVGRSTAATIHDSRGVSGSLAAAAAAWTSIDWDGDGQREADGLVLGDEEALRYFDPANSGLYWPMTAFTLRHDWIETGAADVPDAPYWSFSPDDLVGAYVALVGTGAGEVEFQHFNGDDIATCALPVSAGDRCSARAQFRADGSVFLALVINGGDEVLGDASAPLAVASYWGSGTELVRINELGDTSRGQQIAKYSAVYDGLLSRSELLERL